MLSLPASMHLAGENCIAMLAPSYDHMPMWSMTIEPGMKAWAQFAWPQHNVGRWWDAMLRLEAATGFSIPERIEAAMQKNLQVCFDNPLGLACELITHGDHPPGHFDAHSQRELLLALAARIRYRDDDWARQCGRRMIVALDRYILDDGRIDWEAILRITPASRSGKIDSRQTSGNAAMVHSTGRMIEAIIEYYKVTDDDAALPLVARLAQWHLQETTSADGAAPDVPFPALHTHSYLNTLRGLLRYGVQAKRHEYIERVALTCRIAVTGELSETGFVSHDWGAHNRGDTASTADAAQIALELALHGYCEFFDDVERYVRARILPSQITENLGLTPVKDDDSEEMSQLDGRARGAFGGIYRRHPNGWHTPTTDVTAADLHCLCEIYDKITVATADGLRVNLHFDCDNQHARIEQVHGEQSRSVRITPKKAGRLLVRLPRWAPIESVALTSDGRDIPVQTSGDFALLTGDQVGSQVTVSYALPRRRTTECYGDVAYQFTWRGDEVQSVTPNLDFLPFYPTTPGGIELDAGELSPETGPLEHTNRQQ